MAEFPRRTPRGAARAVLALVGGAAGLVLVAPLLALLLTVIASLPEVLSALGGATALDSLRRSMLVALLVVPLQTVLGITAGLVIVRHQLPGRRLLDALAELPLALSPVMAGLGMVLVFGRGGWLEGLGVAFQLPGVILATAFVTVPFVLRETVLTLETLGDSEEQAAATLGATPWQTFWRVTLPNLWQAVIPGVALTSARCLGEFGASLVIGGAVTHRTQTATTWIQQAIDGRKEPAAYGMALVLISASVGLLLLLRHMRERAKEGAWASR